ncbi:MAG TPA: large conductance mechanosensitive channel protein MscL [Chitinophagaceae bacterium]|nr:large conductance mechanosensitive channel protein MscL [Chitinophagaceae bacterium]
MGMLKEFKDFAMKGNLVDIAVAFVMGGAFGKVVTSFTGDLVAPLVGLLTGKDLSKNMLVIKKGVAEVKDAAGNILIEAKAEVALKWGAFVTTVIDFLIVAFVMFIIIKAINSMKKKEEVAPAATAENILLLREIRDALKK